MWGIEEEANERFEVIVRPCVVVVEVCDERAAGHPFQCEVSWARAAIAVVAGKVSCPYPRVIEVSRYGVEVRAVVTDDE